MLSTVIVPDFTRCNIVDWLNPVSRNLPFGQGRVNGPERLDSDHQYRLPVGAFLLCCDLLRDSDGRLTIEERSYLYIVDPIRPDSRSYDGAGLREVCSTCHANERNIDWIDTVEREIRREQACSYAYGA